MHLLSFINSEIMPDLAMKCGISLPIIELDSKMKSGFKPVDKI